MELERQLKSSKGHCLQERNTGERRLPKRMLSVWKRDVQVAQIACLQNAVTSGALLGSEKTLYNLGMCLMKASWEMMLDRGSVD